MNDRTQQPSDTLGDPIDHELRDTVQTAALNGSLHLVVVEHDATRSLPWYVHDRETRAVLAATTGRVDDAAALARRFELIAARRRRPELVCWGCSDELNDGHYSRLGEACRFIDRLGKVKL